MRTGFTDIIFIFITQKNNSAMVKLQYIFERFFRDDSNMIPLTDIIHGVAVAYVLGHLLTRSWWFDPSLLQATSQISFDKILTPCCFLVILVNHKKARTSLFTKLTLGFPLLLESASAVWTSAASPPSLQQ